MTKYIITHESGDTTIMVADFAQPSSPIRYLTPDGAEVSTPFQVADSCDDPWTAAEQLVHWFAVEGGDFDPVEDVEEEEEEEEEEDSKYQCDRCGRICAEDERAKGWPVPMLDDTYSCPSCYGPGGHCPEGHVLRGDTDSSECLECAANPV